MIFCQDYKEQRRKKPQRKLTGDYTFTFYGSKTEVIPSEWEEVLQNRNFFLSLKYLDIIERLHAGPIASRYVIVYRKKVPVFAAYFQVVDFTADVFGELVASQISDMQSKRLRLFDKYIDKYKDQVIMRLVTCGNNFVSGEHGFVYSDKIKREDAFFLLEKISTLVSKEEKLRGTISATMLKDFYNIRLPQNNILEENKFIEFTVDPNMVIDVPGDVTNITEYIGTFSKKYRNRAKNILKAGDQLVKKDLTEEEVKKYNKEIFSLYENVFTHAKFKLVKLAENYFYEIKKTFPDEFFVTAYFLNDRLVGFDSGYFTDKYTLEAHYIGLDYEVNKEYELYQNILYHFIEVAITGRKKTLDLGRSASEIKSTVGAKPHDLVCYIRPQNTLSQVVLNPFINFLQPAEWIPRNPFKEE
ncbi:MAG TPA: hypothetical protein VNY73_05810 [Bacteroidia bacterium]|nr:hypothetical protein [Bacteroidia bacterium]